MSQKLTRPKPSPVYLPTEDPLLEKLYIARVAAHDPNGMLTYADEYEEALSAVCAFRKAQAEGMNP